MTQGKTAGAVAQDFVQAAIHLHAALAVDLQRRKLPITARVLADLAEIIARYNAVDSDQWAAVRLADQNVGTVNVAVGADPEAIAPLVRDDAGRLCIRIPSSRPSQGDGGKKP